MKRAAVRPKLSGSTESSLKEEYPTDPRERLCEGNLPRAQEMKIKKIAALCARTSHERSKKCDKVLRLVLKYHRSVEVCV